MVIEVPLRRFAVGSYRYGGTIDLFGIANRLVGYRPARRATTPGLIATLKANQVSEDLSTERLLHLQPDATFHYFANGQLQKEMSPLTSVGLREIPMAEHLETDPLAKAEWIKFLALFFNKEEQAERHFAEVERLYNDIAALSQGVRDRPKVFVDEPFGDGWQIFGGNNSTARMIEDAGGEYVFRDDPTSASIRKISYELALDRGLDAPVWLITFDATHRNDLAFRIWNDPRLQRFRSLRENRVFIAHRNFPGLLNPYWDQGLPNPHSLLADVVRILHPELLPNHDLVFFRKLERPGR
jgi:iron complex transport system substrate-binding protein